MLVNLAQPVPRIRPNRQENAEVVPDVRSRSNFGATAGQFRSFPGIAEGNFGRCVASTGSTTCGEHFLSLNIGLPMPAAVAVLVPTGADPMAVDVGGEAETAQWGAAGPPPDEVVAGVRRGLLVGPVAEAPEGLVCVCVYVCVRAWGVCSNGEARDYDTWVVKHGRQEGSSRATPC